MNIQKKLFSALNIELSSELADFFNHGSGEVGDYCHETADGCEDVIYYAKAKALYDDASTSERDEAESIIEDCGGFGEGVDMAARFTQLAYWITYNRLASELREQAESLVEALKEKNENRATRQEWGVIIDETVEALEYI